MIDIFFESQDPNYFHHLTVAMGILFHTTIKIEEMVESGLKKGTIVRQITIKATTYAIQRGSIIFENRKRKEEIASLASSSGVFNGILILLTHKLRENPSILSITTLMTFNIRYLHICTLSFMLNHMCILLVTLFFGTNSKKPSPAMTAL